MLSVLFGPFYVRPFGSSLGYFFLFILLINYGVPATLQNFRVGNYFSYHQSVMLEHPLVFPGIQLPSYHDILQTLKHISL